MISHMNSVTNEIVESVEQQQDYVQLCFGSGAIVNIYNSYSVEGCDSISEFAHALVVSVAEDENSLRLNFGNRGQLVVDLRPDAFVGPEAIQLHRPGAGLIVWS